MNAWLPIWRIAYKEIKALRDVKMLIYLLVTPIAITLLLGTMLAGDFKSSAAIGDIRVLYQDNGASSELKAYWEAYAGQIGASGIVMERADGQVDGIGAVAENRYVGYAELANDGIRYYGSSRSTVESDIAQSVIAAFTDRYKVAVALSGDDPAQAEAVMASPGSLDAVQEQSLDADRKPSAMDYYAIAMMTLIVMYGSMSAAGLMSDERTRHTSVRLMAAPITKGQIFTGKILGTVLQHTIAVVVVILVCKYMFNVYWGDNLALVLLVMVSQIIFAISLGLGASYLIPGKAAASVMMIIIQIAAFFGGSYFPLEHVTGVLRAIADLSPLEWTNTALLQIIYAGNGAAGFGAIALNIGISITMLVAAVLIMRKREGL